MPGYKSYKRRRSYKRRAPTYTVGGSAMFLAKKALAGLNAVRGIINSEKKYHDTNFQFANVTYNGALECLSKIPAGDDTMQRNGNSILAKSVYIQGQILSAPGAQSFGRLIVFMDKMNQGIDPTMSDILSLMGSQYAPTSPINVDSTSRYQILRDKRYAFDDSKGLTTVIKEFIPLNTHIKFRGTASSDIYKNAIYVMYVSDRATYVPDVNIVSRLGYYDN